MRATERMNENGMARSSTPTTMPATVRPVCNMPDPINENFQTLYH